MKTATQWRPSTSGTSSPDNAGDFLLLETGDHILLETGDSILLEDSVTDTVDPVAWTAPSKIASSWKPETSGTSVAVEDSLITEQGDTRITEQGDTRILEGSEVSTKDPIVWSES